MSGLAWARGLAEGLRGLFFPWRCLGCGHKAAQEAELICPRCWADLPLIPASICRRCGAPRWAEGGLQGPCGRCRHWDSSLETARAAVLYRDLSRKLVHGLKFDGWSELATLLARPMARQVEQEGWAAETDLLVPVPLSRNRYREREYNQSLLLAEALGRMIGRPVGEVLGKQSGGRPQTDLEGTARWKAVQGMFRVLTDCRSAVSDRSILLVDDVLTTGATLSVCAKALTQAGAWRVRAITFTRVP